MKPGNITFTAENGLCCGCGVCAGICPSGCISWHKKNGMYLPEINERSCVSCGLCAGVCPGLTHQYDEADEAGAVRGNVSASFNAWNLDPQIRHMSASGGVVSGIIDTLMSRELYDAVFAVDSYDYSGQLKTKPFTRECFDEVKNSSLPKSRYLPVSHEEAVRYIKENAAERVIFIGTSCAVRGIRRAVERLGRNREQYLFIGLFCDRVFNYDVIRYYQNTFAEEGKVISRLHFKNKESGGWPGNMKLFYTDGSSEYLDREERVKVKDYFMPERCLYCIDKLNVCADISLGDNYTKQNSSELGSNSVLIRTENGMRAWEQAKDCLAYDEVPVEAVMEAQYIDGRLNNFCYSVLKEKQISRKKNKDICLNPGVRSSRDIWLYEDSWKDLLGKLHAGEVYTENPGELNRRMNAVQRGKTNLFVRMYKKLSRTAKRIFY